MLGADVSAGLKTVLVVPVNKLLAVPDASAVFILYIHHFLNQ